jgi:hypothetical protein
VGVTRGSKLAESYREASENKESDKRLSNYRQYRGLCGAIVKDRARRRRGSEGPRRYLMHPNSDDHANRKNAGNEQ